MKNLICITGFIVAMTMSGSSFAQQESRVQVNRDSLQNTNDIVKKYNDGKVLVFDLSEEEQKDEKKAVMNEVSGMVIGDNKMVYAKKGPQGTQFLVLEKQMRQDKQAKALEKFEATTPTATSEQQK
jgi:hypothetical protein